MKTAGQILSIARSQKRFDISDVSRITKIRPEFLYSIESDDYGKLPSGTVARGFIRNYAEVLDLNPTQVLAVFRRDFVENQLGQIVPRGMLEPVSKTSFWTPRTTLITTVALIFTLFAGYLVYQYRILTGPPPLKLISPSDSQTVGESTVEVSGSTDPESTISVNNQLVALDKGGRFSFRLPLNPGENIITITATSKFGKTTVTSRKVYNK